MLVYFALGDANFSRFYPTRNLKVASGIFSHRACTFHVFCVDFICVRHPTQTRFLVEYGLFEPKTFLKCILESDSYEFLHSNFAFQKSMSGLFYI